MLHFHDADYFLQSIFNCCLINIKDMFENGTVMNGKLIESQAMIAFLLEFSSITSLLSWRIRLRMESSVVFALRTSSLV